MRSASLSPSAALRRALQPSVSIDRRGFCAREDSLHSDGKVVTRAREKDRCREGWERPIFRCTSVKPSTAMVVELDPTSSGTAWQPLRTPNRATEDANRCRAQEMHGKSPIVTRACAIWLDRLRVLVPTLDPSRRAGAASLTLNTAASLDDPALLLRREGQIDPAWVPCGSANRALRVLAGVLPPSRCLLAIWAGPCSKIWPRPLSKTFVPDIARQLLHDEGAA